MRLRKIEETDIRYVIIADNPEVNIPIFPPLEIKTGVFDFIRKCPISVLQLANAQSYHSLNVKLNRKNPFDLNIFFIKDEKLALDFINETNQIHLVFLNGESEEHLELYAKMKADNKENIFFCFYNDPFINQDKNTVLTPNGFINKIIANKEIINDKFSDLEIETSIPIGYKSYNEKPTFSPGFNNYYILNGLTSNFGENQSFPEVSDKEMQSEMENGNTFNRQISFIDTITKIDTLYTNFYINKVIEPVTSFDVFLNPLIIVSPYSDPNMKKIFGKDFSDSYQLEQTENYFFTGEEIKKDKIEEGVKFIKLKLNYLDDVAFLHSSFTFSPVVRLPLQGKSINRELSFFSPESKPIKDRKLNKTIINFGKQLNLKTISTELSEIIKKRNGQIIVISDIPFEWLVIDDVPLAFTHDICRIPETSLSSILGQFTSNKLVDYSISKDILSKTLVILGNEEENFMAWQGTTLELSKKLGFTFVICLSNTDVKEAILKHKPELLIFDCHGGFDEETYSTYLEIGNDRLDNKYIVDNQITAPLVFLSACGTAPTYGTFNSIANGFFESGALAVTTTYLPIKIDSGSLLYIRLLNQLSEASNKVIHKNWLSFVSHIIRTSSIQESYLKAIVRNKDQAQNQDVDDVVKTQAKALLDSMMFKERPKLYKELDKRISNLVEEDKAHYSKTLPEFLLYSNLGRQDLINFDSWNEEFYNKNKIEL